MPHPRKHIMTASVSQIGARKNSEQVASVLQSCLAATCLDWLMNDVLNRWLSCSCVWQL